jgi:hypothetical protein
VRHGSVAVTKPVVDEVADRMLETEPISIGLRLGPARAPAEEFAVFRRGCWWLAGR